MQQFPFSFWKSGVVAPDLMSGADGALSINGTTVNIDAGDIKRYTSVSIINNGVLFVRGTSLGIATNAGTTPTIIGVSGNLTINTGGKIQLTQNSGMSEFGYIGVTFSAPTVPFDSAVNPISYTFSGIFGGEGCPNGDGSAGGGFDNVTAGCGGGGGGDIDQYGGGAEAYDWGKAGNGGNGTGSGDGGVGSAASNGFSLDGTVGLGGEVGTGTSYGGGGGGGVRSLSGGCLYLQVAGTVSVSGTVIDIRGGNAGSEAGGAGGGGGYADSPDSPAYGGGGGGGGAGGNGGKVIIRYISGSITSANVLLDAGIGGLGGVGGTGTTNNGQDGQAGSDGNVGTVDIATY